LKELSKLKGKNQENAVEEDPSSNEEDLSSENDEYSNKNSINLDELRNQAVRVYIRILSKHAISDEFRKNKRRLNSIKMVSLDPSVRSGSESLSQSFKDFIAGADEIDTANKTQQFDEAMSERIAQATDRDLDQKDSSYLDIVDAVTMRQFWATFRSKLSEAQRQEFDFFFGLGSRDIYKEGRTPDGSEFVSLDTNNAEELWQYVFGKRLSASRIAQKKRNLELLIEYALYRNANANPEFFEILNKTIALQKEDTEQGEEDIYQQYSNEQATDDTGQTRPKNVDKDVSETIKRLRGMS
jgi:hypothetical protein